MTNSTSTNHRRAIPALLALTALLSAPAAVHAGSYSLFGGDVLAVTKTTIAFGAAFRNADANPQLVGAGAGQGDNPEFPGAHGAVGVNDDPNLNFKKGDVVSAPMTLLSDLTFKHKSGLGLFIRLRGWYDMALESKTMPHGTGPTGYVRDIQMNDSGYLGAARFKGFDVYDAFLFFNDKIGNSAVGLRLGRQAIEWGESVLYPGLNAINPYDVAWAVMPGAPPANGGKLPVARLAFNVAGGKGWTVDGFYNLEFRETVTPGCGEWNSYLDNGLHPGCNTATAAGLTDIDSVTYVKTKAYYMGKLWAGGIFPNGGPDSPDSPGKPSQWSGYGLSVHKFVEALGTEFGFYFARFTSPTPVVGPVVGTSAMDFAVDTNYKAGVDEYGLSAATGARNLALFGQIVYTVGVPGQRNAPAFIEGSISGLGPYYWMKAHPNTEFPWFDMNVAQLQFGGTWQFGHLIRLSDATITAEANMQWVTNMPPADGTGAERLGRYGNFGLANWNQQGYVCSPGPLSNGIVNKCQIDGFYTQFAAGYKIRAQATLPRPSKGITWVPVLVFQQDLTGFSSDGAVIAGRLSLGAYLTAVLRQTYYVTGGVVVYDRGAAWDPAADRGQYTIAFGMNL
jgi:hypothetical protein